jgi:hypothetical protein
LIFYIHHNFDFILFILRNSSVKWLMSKPSRMETPWLSDATLLATDPRKWKSMSKGTSWSFKV